MWENGDGLMMEEKYGEETEYMGIKQWGGLDEVVMGGEASMG